LFGKSAAAISVAAVAANAPAAEPDIEKAREFAGKPSSIVIPGKTVTVQSPIDKVDMREFQIVNFTLTHEDDFGKKSRAVIFEAYIDPRIDGPRPDINSYRMGVVYDVHVYDPTTGEFIERWPGVLVEQTVFQSYDTLATVIYEFKEVNAL